MLKKESKMFRSEKRKQTTYFNKFIY